MDYTFISSYCAPNFDILNMKYKCTIKLRPHVYTHRTSGTSCSALNNYRVSHKCKKEITLYK